MTRAQLTDKDWEFVKQHLPTLRQQFEGVIWRFWTGGQWWEMPSEFGAWPTVSNRFRQWRDAGVFDALLEDLIAEAAPEREERRTPRRSGPQPGSGMPMRRQGGLWGIT